AIGRRTVLPWWCHEPAAITTYVAPIGSIGGPHAWARTTPPLASSSGTDGRDFVGRLCGLPGLSRLRLWLWFRLLRLWLSRGRCRRWRGLGWLARGLARPRPRRVAALKSGVLQPQDRTGACLRAGHQAGDFEKFIRAVCFTADGPDGANRRGAGASGET